MNRVHYREIVFAVIFLLLFAVGTICGGVLFRLADPANCPVTEDGKLFLSAEQPRLASLLSWLRPIALAGLLAWAPWGRRALPVLIVCRGMLLGYCACFYFLAGQFPGLLMTRAFVCLPLFYYVCRMVFLGEISETVRDRAFVRNS